MPSIVSSTSTVHSQSEARAHTLHTFVTFIVVASLFSVAPSVLRAQSTCWSVNLETLASSHALCQCHCPPTSTPLPARRQQLDALARAPSSPYHRAVGTLARAPWAPFICGWSTLSAACCCHPSPHVFNTVVRAPYRLLLSKRIISLANAPSTALPVVALHRWCPWSCAVGALVNTPPTPSSTHPRHPHPCVPNALGHAPRPQIKGLLRAL